MAALCWADPIADISLLWGNRPLPAGVSAPWLLSDVVARVSSAKVQRHCYMSISFSDGDFIDGNESRISQLGV